MSFYKDKIKDLIGEYFNKLAFPGFCLEPDFKIISEHDAIEILKSGVIDGSNIDDAVCFLHVKSL